MVDLNPDIIATLSSQLTSEDMDRGMNMMPEVVATLLISHPYTTTSPMAHVPTLTKQLPEPTPLIQTLTLQESSEQASYIDRYVGARARSDFMKQADNLDTAGMAYDWTEVFSVYQRGCQTPQKARQTAGFQNNLLGGGLGAAALPAALDELY